MPSHCRNQLIIMDLDVISSILDEIALEGLAGITIQTLFERLRHRPGFELAIDEHTKKYIWDIIRQISNINFYVLPAKRQELIIPDDLNNQDNFTKFAILESEIYPFKIVSWETHKEVGSCVDYETRKDVTKAAQDLNLEKIEEKWGSKFVIVAQFHIRCQALSKNLNMVDFSRLTSVPLTYILLEMIGRTRLKGLKSAGPGSALTIFKTPNISFSYSSSLTKLGLIKKINQTNGVLLILTRFIPFFNEAQFDFGYRILTEKAIAEAQKRPDGLILRKRVYEMLLPTQSPKRLRQSHVFKKYFQRLNVPHRTFYPNATEKEYLNKNKSEKREECFKLLENVTEIEICEESEEEISTINRIDKDLYIGVDFNNQIYHEILKSGSNGKSAADLRQIFDVEPNAVKVALSRLVKENEITTFPIAAGRQTIHMYVVSKNEQINVEKMDKNEKMTARKTFRIGCFLRAIKENRSMTFSQIYTHVRKEEFDLNMKYEMDRRSSKRILDQMVADGLIKTYSDSKSDYFCDLSFDPNQKIDENLTVDHYVKLILAQAEDAVGRLVSKSGNQVKKSSKAKKTSRTATPKFLRLSILHDVLFYLVRDYQGDTTRTNQELLDSLKATVNIDEKLEKEMPKLYMDHLSCYMFTPPLSPVHTHAPGWCAIIEIILNAPLSSITTLISDRMFSSEMSFYLNDPVRQHFPVFALPMHFRQHLLSMKTLYYLSMDVRRLCFMGLVQMGTRHNPRKIMSSAVYVNQKATILDTTESEMGALEIEKGRTYPTRPYFFRELKDVKHYWIDLFNICHQTRLGAGRNGSKNVDKNGEFEQESLIAAQMAVTNDEAIEKDNGTIPGNQLGAGGLHSAMFSFMFSNWMNDKQKTRGKRIIKNNVTVSITPKKKKPEKKKTDRDALLPMTKLRVSWSAQEDTILAMCKVVIALFSRSARSKIRIKAPDMQEALKRHCGHESLDKTQIAIRKRVISMNTMVRWSSLGSITQIARKLPETERFLSPFANISKIKLDSPEAKEMQIKLSETFQELVQFLIDRFVENGIIVPLQETVFPDTIEELREIYDLSEKPERFKLNHVKENAVRAVVLSSLASNADKTSLVAQLLDVYRQFDESLLRQAVLRLHRQSVIAGRKRQDPKKKRFFVLGNCSYHFSQKFTQLLTTKFNQAIYHNAYLELNRLLCCSIDETIELDLMSCGPAVFPLTTLGHVKLTISIPEQFVAFDTNNLVSSSKIVKQWKKAFNKTTDECEERPAKRIKLEPDEDFINDSEMDDDDDGPIEAPVGFLSSRLALTRLREIAVGEIDPKNRTLRSTIDMCAVSSSKIMCTPNHSELVKEYGIADGNHSKDILQLVHDRSNFLVCAIDVDKTLEKENDADLRQLYSIIDDKGEMGATLSDLRNFGNNASTLVRKLENLKLILRTGVYDIRYVSRKNADIWSIKSHKMTRLEKEKMDPSILTTLSFDTVYREPETSKASMPEAKTIQVIMRPWVRVDGTTNRRVLDRMLGTILGYIMSYPGISCLAIIRKFSPAFTAVWIRELIDLLEKIGCIKQITLKKCKTTLFSQTDIQLNENLDGLEENSEILLDPKFDATVTLGQFIGNKSYVKDMLA